MLIILFFEYLKEIPCILNSHNIIKTIISVSFGITITVSQNYLIKHYVLNKFFPIFKGTLNNASKYARIHTMPAIYN